MLIAKRAGVMVLVCGLAGGLAVTQDKPAPAPTPGSPTAPPRPARQPRQPRTAPAKAPGTDDAKPVARPAPLWGPWVTREDPQDVMVQVNLRVRSDNIKQKERFRDPHTGKTVDMPKVTPFDFDAMSLVWPYITTTAGSDLIGETVRWPEGSVGEVGFKGRLSVGEYLVDDEPNIVSNGYHSGTRLARWEASKESIERVKTQRTVREVDLQAEYPVRCYKVKFDEAGASTVGWPEVWPEEAALTLQPQMWVEKGVNEQGAVAEYDREQVRAVLEKYLKEDGIESPKSLTPVRLAKVLAGKVWRDVAPTLGTGMAEAARRGMFEGFLVRPPAVTLETGKGSPHDMNAALVALYREAGIPTRLVIGIDSGDGGGGLSGSREVTVMRSWLEFAVYDEGANAINWVPVDIVRLRKVSSKPQKLDATWRYFGNNDELDQVAPISFGFTPPGDGVVTHGSPKLWGWMVFPQQPQYVDSWISFGTGGVPKKASKELVPVEPLKPANMDAGARERRPN